MRDAISMIGLCALGFSFVACGGISETPLATSAVDAGESHDAADAVLDEGGTSERDGASNQDGSVIDGDAAVVPIDPITPGEIWTYDVSITGDFPACNEGTFPSAVGSKQSLDGRDAYLVGSFCPSLGSYSYSTEGDRVWEYVNGQWLVGLDSPVLDGHSWSVGSQSFTWHSVGTIAVPAGTFSDCWEARENSASETYSIFLCRGAGPVHWTYRSAQGDGYDAVLYSKNF